VRSTTLRKRLYSAPPGPAVCNQARPARPLLKPRKLRFHGEPAWGEPNFQLAALYPGLHDLRAGVQVPGSLVYYPPTSDADANKRTRAAAFGALRSALYNFALSEVIRGQVHTALVLTILLYGS
jgi:hypothetical protein